MALDKYDSLVRTTYLPVLAKQLGGVADSRYGGSPALVVGEPWPRCGGCQEPLIFLLQLNLSQLPQVDSGLPAKGLIQAFSCFECDDYEGFSETKLCRLLDESKLAKLARSEEGADPYPEKAIINWAPVAKDYPHPEEDAITDLALSGEVLDAYIDDLCDLEHCERDKLFGWPEFYQGIEYETCPDCKKEMAFLMQIVSEDNLPVMWGDMGTAILFYCRQHPNRITFNWACG
jgi:uncharacterized protein YwqG